MVVCPLVCNPSNQALCAPEWAATRDQHPILVVRRVERVRPNWPWRSSVCDQHRLIAREQDCLSSHHRPISSDNDDGKIAQDRNAAVYQSEGQSRKYINSIRLARIVSIPCGKLTFVSWPKPSGQYERFLYGSFGYGSIGLRSPCRNICVQE